MPASAAARLAADAADVVWTPEQTELARRILRATDPAAAFLPAEKIERIEREARDLVEAYDAGAVGAKDCGRALRLLEAAMVEAANAAEKS